MQSIFLAFSGALALIVHSSQAIAQNPNDLVYENKPLSQWIGELKDKNPTTKAGACLALGHIARFPSEGETSLIKELLPSMLALLKDKESVVRESAAKTLYLIGSARQRRSFMGHCDIVSGIPALIAALKDQNSTVRRWCILALGEIGPEAEAAVPALTEALLDKTIRVRQGAAAALGRIGPKAKSAVPALILALKDRDVSVRWAAASGLAGIGPDAKAALPALRDASESEDIEIQRQATNALKNIDVVIDIQKDSKNFDAIIRYWQQQFPKSTFEGAS
jgi:HEAT repeat protein